MKYIDMMCDELHGVREYFEAAGAEDDFYMRVGLKRIAYEEYTHARFLREEMIRLGLYDPKEHPEQEKKYRETERMFED